MNTYEDHTIFRIEDAKRTLSNILWKYISFNDNDLAELSPERWFVLFMEAIDELLYMDSQDLSERLNIYPETVARMAWDTYLHPSYKQQILAAIPNIEFYMHHSTIHLFSRTDFFEFYMFAFKRVTLHEKNEIIKRAQTKMLKEEIVMKAMHPNRIEKLIDKYGMDALEMF